MPWTETRPMQRLDFIRASQTGTMSFSALCRLFGISRSMFRNMALEGKIPGVTKSSW